MYHLVNHQQKESQKQSNFAYLNTAIVFTWNLTQALQIRPGS